MNKILIGIFSLLLIFLSFELGFFYGSKNVLYNKTGVSASNPFISYSQEEQRAAELFLKDLSSTVAQAKSGLLAESTRYNVYKGVLQEISTEPGTVNSYDYRAKLVLKDTEGSVFPFYLNEKDVEKTRVLIPGKTETGFNLLQTLQQGDALQIEVTVNLLESININTEQITITKLK